MVTQLLFGETYDVLDQSGKWLLIRLHYDGYEGWIDKKQFSAIDEGTNFFKSNWVNTAAIGMLKEVSGTANILLSFGSTLPGLSDGKCVFNGKTYVFSGELADTSLPKPENIRHFAMLFLNAAYLWGGKTIFGIDCSGFTQAIFKAAGIKLYRDAAQQAGQGETIDFIDEAQAGDLAFFDNEEGKIIHTGIILEKGKIIHAANFVRIDSIDHHGIFNGNTQQYTHKLRLIKRMV